MFLPHAREMRASSQSDMVKMDKMVQHKPAMLMPFGGLFDSLDQRMIFSHTCHDLVCRPGALVLRTVLVYIIDGMDVY
jgi:hypothetical protein